MIDQLSAQEVISQLKLESLPQEGGYFRRSYQSQVLVKKADIPQYTGARPTATCIYFLITPESFSAMHVLLSDEIWCYQAGDPIEMVQINTEGELTKVVIGKNIQAGQALQHIVFKNIWQASKLVEGGKWSLVSCMVSPGFEYDDSTVSSREALLELFPQHQKIIEQYTHS